MKRTRYRGFTIVQLLVVLIVLFICAAILFPVFDRAKHNKYDPSCQFNLKQVGLCTMQYRQDYDEKFPLRGRVNEQEDKGWATSLQPYGRSTRMFQCPNDSLFNYEGTVTKTRFTDYYFNLRLNGTLATELRYPESILLLGEGEAASSNYACSRFDKCVGLNNDGLVKSVSKTGRTRHFEGANYAFVDGHVKWFQPEKVSTLPGKNVSISFASR